MKGNSSWRPDGWDKVKEEVCMMGPYQCELFFEDGADALWEELMKYRVKMPVDFTPVLIVIPAKEAKE